MTRRINVTCDGCGATGGGSVIDKLGSGWSTVEISQIWPGIIEKPPALFDLCAHCSERVLPNSWPRLQELI